VCAGLAAGVVFGVDGFEAAVFDVGVDLGGGDAGVAEHFLEGADFGSSGEHVGGKAVAEGVGADSLIGTDALCVTADEFPEHHTGEGTTGAGEEEGAGVFFAGHQRAFVFEVGFDGLDSERIE